MTTDQKIIKNKLVLLKLAQTLGNVSEACNAMQHFVLDWHTIATVVFV